MFHKPPLRLAPTLAGAQDDFTRRANIKIAEERGIRDGEERRVPKHDAPSDLPANDPVLAFDVKAASMGLMEPPRVLDDDTVPLSQVSAMIRNPNRQPEFHEELEDATGEPAPDAWVGEARAARDLLNWLAEDGRVRLVVHNAALQVVRLIPRTVYDEEAL